MNSKITKCRCKANCFRTISGNPRQFNYRDESVRLCMSAIKQETRYDNNGFQGGSHSCTG